MRKIFSFLIAIMLAGVALAQEPAGETLGTPDHSTTSFGASKTKPPAKERVTDTSCNRYSVLENMFSDFCWAGVFPIRIAGVNIWTNGTPFPENAYKQVLCKCSGDLKEMKLPKIGFPVGMWMPSRLVDVVRRPYCFASLGVQGGNLGVDFLSQGANIGRSNHHLDSAFANWIMYSTPYLYMLRLLDDDACPPDGLFDFDLLYMSTFFPNWNDVLGRYSLFLSPEAILFANPLTLAAGPMDMANIIAEKKPSNKLFWVAGNWGNLMPFTGFTGASAGAVDVTSLIAARSMALMHRLGMVKETVGADNICERKVTFVMQKDAIRWQMVAPSPETTDDTPSARNVSGQVRLTNFPSKLGVCTHPTGYPTAAWGMWRDVPATGEDHSYMILRWTDCCFGFTPTP